MFNREVGTTSTSGWSLQRLPVVCYNRLIDNPCRTLSYTLDHLHNATQVVLLRSTVDYPLDNGLVVVDNKHIFSLEGESGFVATIRCSNQSGFVFSEIEYISLVNLHVTGCGTVLVRTTLMVLLAQYIICH